METMHGHAHYILITQAADSWGAIAAIGTVVAAFISLYSAKQSAKSSLEAKRATQASMMPILEPHVIAICSEGSSEYFTISFKNVGKGIAQNIFLEVPGLNISKKHATSVNPDGNIVEIRTDPAEGCESLLKEAGGNSLMMTLTYEDIFGNILTSIGFDFDQSFYRAYSPKWTVRYRD